MAMTTGTGGDGREHWGITGHGDGGRGVGGELLHLSRLWLQAVVGQSGYCCWLLLPVDAFPLDFCTRPDIIWMELSARSIKGPWLMLLLLLLHGLADGEAACSARLPSPHCHCDASPSRRFVVCALRRQACSAEVPGMTAQRTVDTRWRGVACEVEVEADPTTATSPPHTHLRNHRPGRPAPSGCAIAAALLRAIAISSFYPQAGPRPRVMDRKNR